VAAGDSSSSSRIAFAQSVLINVRGTLALVVKWGPACSQVAVESASALVGLLGGPTLMATMPFGPGICAGHGFEFHFRDWRKQAGLFR